MAEKKLRFETLQIHGGLQPDDPTGARGVAIYPTAAYRFKSCEHAANLFDLSEGGNIYTRLQNPTTTVYEQRIAALYGAVGALAVSSGMSAILIAVLSLAAEGDNIVASPFLYGGTFTQFRISLRRLGIDCRIARSERPEDFEALIDGRTKAIYAESMGNPTCTVPDLEALGQLAKRYDVPFVADNTFGAAGYLCNPFEWGANIVVDSATKWINGHGTATAGLVADLTPDAVDVMVLRVYDDNNMSKASRVLTALEYALENGAAVVNLSLGWTNAIEKGYSFLNNVLAQAYASGVVVVAAAGNRGQSNPAGNADDVYPANQEAVLTVSGVNRSRAFDSSYSSSGTAVDLCAPGSNVVVAAPGGGTSVRSGTSFAAPHIAAAAACVRLAQPGLSAAGVRQMLYRYADDLGDPGRDDAYGYGLPVLTRYFHDRLCPGQRFRDMPASDIWSHEGLDYCIAAGLISGTSEVTVSPDMLATRAQIVQLLWAAAGSPETAGTLPFTDVSTDAWFYPAVRWAYRTGLVSGTSETTFDPEAPITRQDFALILYTQSGSPAMTGSVLRNFPDVEQVSGYAYAALTWAVEQGLINGVGTPEGALLAPHGYASRAQVATILMAYCDR